MSILYVWCQLNKDTIVNFWFGTQFKAMYLPWVLFGFNMIIAGGGVMELVGILIGHMYFFLMFKYPQVRISRDAACAGLSLAYFSKRI